MIAEAGAEAPNLTGLRILLVEDEAMVAMLIEAMLETLGCQMVQWVASVPAALEAIDRLEFDGAVLDVNLSGTVVYPVADRLVLHRLPFLFATGYGQTAEIKQRFPGCRVLKKPFNAAELARGLKGEIAARAQSGTFF
jgi:CheY-like chemotaxis protein